MCEKIDSLTEQVTVSCQINVMPNRFQKFFWNLLYRFSFLNVYLQFQLFTHER